MIARYNKYLTQDIHIQDVKERHPKIKIKIKENEKACWLHT